MLSHHHYQLGHACSYIPAGQYNLWIYQRELGFKNKHFSVFIQMEVLPCYRLTSNCISQHASTIQSDCWVIISADSKILMTCLLNKAGVSGQNKTIRYSEELPVRIPRWHAMMFQINCKFLEMLGFEAFYCYCILVQCTLVLTMAHSISLTRTTG